MNTESLVVDFRCASKVRRCHGTELQRYVATLGIVKVEP